MALWTKENTHFFTNAVYGKSLQDFFIETFYALDKLKAWIGFVMDYYRLSTLYYSFFEYTFPYNYSVLSTSYQIHYFDLFLLCLVVLHGLFLTRLL